MEPMMTKPNSLLSSLDTSGFALVDNAEYENSDADDYDASYFDIEKATSSNSNKRAQKNGVSSVNFETDVFDLGPRRSTPNRNSYAPGPYNKYESSKEFENQRPRSHNPGTSKNTPQSANVACNSPQMLKKFLMSGSHGNDPRKIQAMIKKCQTDQKEAQDGKDHSKTNGGEDDESNAQSIFEKYSLKGSKSKSNVNKDRKSFHKNDPSQEPESKLPPTSFLPPGYNGFESSKKNSKINDGSKKIGNNDARSTSHDEEEYDDDDYYDDEEDYEDKESDSLNTFKPYGGIAKPKGISSSSNLFRKFVKNNVGKSIRRPLTSNDEESKVASEIFKKYSSVNLKRPKGSYSKVGM